MPRAPVTGQEKSAYNMKSRSQIWNINVNGVRADNFSAPMEEMTVMNVDAATQNPYESIHIVKAPNFTNLCRAEDFSAPSEIM